MIIIVAANPRVCGFGTSFFFFWKPDALWPLLLETKGNGRRGSSLFWKPANDGAPLQTH